ncbi:hypothetical protein EPJ66_01965 [Brachyspira aalborgi]|uniref:hypothetical protein n=1 Tax=Brachyspira aalborgi TaxID=29522 RepID=UPI0011C973EA|nr:hypothetical protein [Brachyspira aalborgi]TXJ54092.1 hypothetical protein EPJ66_01965 [Brachyspira aalborgi]
MRFNLIREPAENPIDLLNSYRQQNIMMQKIRVLHTAFDGIKLTNWSDSNRELPNILIGSVCEFEGRLFEAEDNIILTDSDDSDGERFIRLAIVRENQVIDSDSDYLIAELVSSKMPEYDYYNRGFYSKVDGFIKYKYLRLAMKYSKTLGGYVEKKYWNISDLMRAGITFKKHSVSFGVGTHTFNVPDSANSITVHLVSGGGGGSPGLSQTADSKNAETGGVSKISINNKDITVCGGGVGGYYLGNFKWQMGIGGKASGMGKLIQGTSVQKVNGTVNNPKGAILMNNITLASGGNGGDGGQAGGGSGSAAIVEITIAILGNSKQIKITVGAGGKGGENWQSSLPVGGKGQDGSAVVEYFSRG